MSSSYETCVYCILLEDAGPHVPAHAQLVRMSSGGSAIGGHTLHSCGVCRTQWRFQATTGWQRDERAA